MWIGPEEKEEGRVQRGTVQHPGVAVRDMGYFGGPDHGVLRTHNGCPHRTQ